jgi:hypothetical protein
MIGDRKQGLTGRRRLTLGALAPRVRWGAGHRPPHGNAARGHRLAFHFRAPVLVVVVVIVILFLLTIGNVFAATFACFFSSLSYVARLPLFPRPTLLLGALAADA